MMSKYDLNDLYVTRYGDFSLQDGDLLDTFTFGELHNVMGVSLQQEIINRVESYSEDWQLYPDLCANLRDYIGTIASVGLNYVKTAASESIRRILTFDGLLFDADLQIQPYMTGPQSILFALNIVVPGGSATLYFNYDFADNKFRMVYR